MHCSACGTENPAGQRFCNGCGAPLAASCASCGAANPPGARFCGSCGAPLEAGVAPAGAVPVAERRLVSVLFADLVGFTAISEARDAEEVRELLSRYFETCRRLIEVYGGTVEKFIGDAVMAVWGAPVATEQDAERAVRAGLDLVAAVAGLGDELGVESLRARVGVLTGEAAVTVGAAGEGMVAGDLVNTASRIQSAAQPGTLLVGDATRRATEATVVYEPAGAFELKGKAGETELWRAVRVVSGSQGALRAERLEPPFVGRERELRLVKDGYLAASEESRARLISIVGIAGIGKSRLAWEFFKYVDGLAQEIWWHQGRCLAYGEGVAYWALADMVRMRCGIAEDDTPEAALAKLGATLTDVVADAEERERIEQRLAQLLGLGEQAPAERNELFAAWRLFFERLAEQGPLIMVFEDMQWADASLLDFVEYLLDWSRNLPIFVVTLARPELLDKRPTWGAGLRHFGAVYLEPLPRAAIAELLEGLVPGLPAGLATQIVDRAAGVPLYAVETVRMLLDRGALVQDGPVCRVVGEIGSLEVPETLQALIASRLDGLPAEERRLLQDAAILGKTFAAGSLAALADVSEDALEEPLTSLVRKEILGVQANPRSPEHGQYGFLQDLVRHVVYQTLSKRERRARHLAAADRLAATMPEEEVAEVLAAHLAEAYALDPEADDAAEIRDRARGSLVHAADRAAALGAAAEGSRYLARAAELCADEVERGYLELRGASLAFQAGLFDESTAGLERCLERFAGAGERPGELQALVKLAWVDQGMGRLALARARLEPALAELDADELDPTIAELVAQFGQVLTAAGDHDAAAPHLERAIEMAEALGLTEIFANAVITKALSSLDRKPREAQILLAGALELAEENGLTWVALRALNNLGSLLVSTGRWTDALGRLSDGVERARRAGDRQWEMMMLGATLWPLAMLGSWDEALARAIEVEELDAGGQLGRSTLLDMVDAYIGRGELDALQALLERVSPAGLSTDDPQIQATVLHVRTALALERGDAEAAVAAAFEGLALASLFGEQFNRAVEITLEALAAAGDTARMRELIASIDERPPGAWSPWLRAIRARFGARLEGDAAQFEVAEQLLRQRGMRFKLAVVLLEHAEAVEGDEAEALREEARAIFTELGATPWLERCELPAAVDREAAAAALDA